MQVNLIDIWHNMGFLVRCVVALLTMQAIGCVAVTIDRIVLLTRSSSRARTFAASVQSAMAAGAYQSVLGDAAQYQDNHLASYLEVGLRTFLARKAAGGETTHAAELARRALERKGDAISRDLNRGMNVLASTGSTAPFVGLLGTVLGIINAFKLIAATGSGGIGSIGAAIGEALVVTGYGLIVAIPSVLIFNYLSSRIGTYEAGLLNAGSELVDRLELSDEGAAARPQPVPQPALQPIPQPRPQASVPPAPPQPQLAGSSQSPLRDRFR
jgi:biopolymer transport protein ExbB/TolQ